MKKVLVIFIAMIMLCGCATASAGSNSPNIFVFLSYYEGYMEGFTNEKNYPSQYFCFPSDSTGIYTNQEVTLTIFFNCMEGNSFEVMNVSLSGDDDLLYQICATVLTLKTYGNPYGADEEYINKMIDLSFDIYLMDEGEEYECEEFKVVNGENSFVFLCL